MSLINIERITAQRYMATWHIEEDESSLYRSLEMYPFDSGLLSTYKVPEKRLEWLAARLTVLKLCEYMSIAYQGIDKDDYGKPFVKGSTAELSISHSYPYVCAIIDMSKAVGIDIEQPRPKLAKVAHKFMSSDELNYCKNDLTMLCVVWCAKETLYKIYSKRGLIFRQHLAIAPFNLKSAGIIDGTIIIGDYFKTFNLRYQWVNDHIVVFNKD